VSTIGRTLVGTDEGIVLDEIRRGLGARCDRHEPSNH
jgi:hypothetical protein